MADRKLFCNLVGVDITEQDPNGHVVKIELLGLFVDRDACLYGCEGGPLTQKLPAGCPIDAELIRKMPRTLIGTDVDIMNSIQLAECQPLTKNALSDIKKAFGVHTE